jgi:uncharacterized membrane protein YagU involved in acid resistance
VFSFPNPVNEVAARTVAAAVAVSAVVVIVLGTAVDHGWLWLGLALWYGFLARTLTGPTLSPLGQFATRIAAPRIGHEKLVAGPPKRFAQAMGLAMTTIALVFLAAGLWIGTVAVLALVLVAATLESTLGYCIGCRVFAALMRLGIVPEETCEACADIWSRQPSAV